MKIKKRFCILLILIIVMCVAIIGVLAFFTDKAEENNTFVFGNVEIVPNEPEWTPDPSPLTPHSELPKNPQIANNGSEEAVVFIKLDVPVRTFVPINPDGSKGTEVTDEIFYMKTDDVATNSHKTQFNDVEHGGNWILLSKTSGEESGEYRTYIFGYRKILGVSEKHIDNVLNPDPEIWRDMVKTEPLFDKVQVKNFVEGTLLGNYNVKLSFYAIQAEYLSDMDSDDLTENLFEDGHLKPDAVLDESVLKRIFDLYTSTELTSISKKPSEDALITNTEGGENVE